MRFAHKLQSWSKNWLPSGPIAHGQKLLQVRMHRNWLILIAALFVILLSGCAAAPTQCLPAQPPKELLTPPPPPGSVSEQLEQILSRGQTSAPN